MNQIIVRTGHAADPIYNYRFVESHAIPVAVRVRVIIGRKPISIENFIQPPLRRKSMRSDRPSGRRNIAAGHKELQFGNAPVRTVGRIQSPVAIFFRGPNGNHIGKNNAVDTIQNLCNPEVGIVGGFDPGRQYDVPCVRHVRSATSYGLHGYALCMWYRHSGSKCLRRHQS